MGLISVYEAFLDMGVSPRLCREVEREFEALAHGRHPSGGMEHLYEALCEIGRSPVDARRLKIKMAHTIHQTRLAYMATHYPNQASSA